MCSGSQFSKSVSTTVVGVSCVAVPVIFGASDFGDCATCVNSNCKKCTINLSLKGRGKDDTDFMRS